MENPAALAMLKTSLGFYGQTPPGVEELLKGKLDQAEDRLSRAGLVLDLAEVSDLQFLVSTAEWLYRKRDAGPGLSRMIREELHDRQVAKCTGGAT